MSDRFDLSTERRNQVARTLDAYLAATDRLDRIVRTICTALAAFLLVLVVTQVVLRYTPLSPLLWGNELATYLAIWIAMLLVGPLIRRDEHLQIEMAFRRLSRRMQRWLRSGQLAAIAVFGLTLAYWGYEYTMTSGFRSTALSMDADMAWFYAVLPVSGVLIAIFSIAKLVEINRDAETLDRDYERRYGTAEERE